MDPGAGSLTRHKRYELRGASRADNGCRDVDASPRFLFYSNECVGLGHLRRCLRLARGLTEADPRSSALIVTGSPVATSYSLPPRVDLVKLPALARDEEGNHLPERLAIDVDMVSRVRSRLAVTVASEFDPTVAVIDKTPLGLRSELVPVLELLQTRSCRLVLGLRDVEDGAESLRRHWAQGGVREALERWYDTILVYGPSTSADALELSRLERSRHPDPSRRIRRSAGRPSRPRRPAGGLSPGDRGRRRRRLPAAVAVRRGPAPQAPRVPRRRRRRSLDAARPALPVARARRRASTFASSSFAGTWTASSSAPGRSSRWPGYNTVSELLVAGKPGLIVPGVRPSREQRVRAEMLAESGVVQVLDPETLDPASVRAALDRLLEAPPPRVDLAQYQGAARATAIVTELAASPAA